MIFRFVQERANRNGSVERLITDFATSKEASRELVVGRGGDAHVVLPSDKVSLVHAKFAWERDVLTVSDMGSLTGVRVGGRRVARADLRGGDIVELGDITIRVEIGPDCVELVATIPATQEGAQEQPVIQQVSKLRIEHYLPAMSTIVSVVAVVGVVALFVYPLLSWNFSWPNMWWSSGPVSNSHKLLEGDCQKCHAQPFQRVQDRECLACHALTKHSTSLAAFNEKHPEMEMRCAQCHMEHNGNAGIISKDSEFCVGCHANMQAWEDKSLILNVRDLQSHPEFRISVKEGADRVIRASIDDAGKAVDYTRIRLNHKIHLKTGLRGKDGPVTLQCNSCHQLDRDFKRLKPINFDSHCRDCHSLGFDERLPNAEVPHGDAELVYPALFTEYTKLLLLKKDGGGALDYHDQPRAIPGAAQSAEGSQGFNAAVVAESARHAERQLFARTGCFLCHAVTEKSVQERTDANSHYAVATPAIPDTWFPAARFSHGAHEEFACESCHEKARNSVKTTDLLLPGKKTCQQCHADRDTVGFVRSGCAACHSYHDAIGISREKKQSIADYLHDLTR